MITAGHLLRSYVRAIDARDWDAVAALLAPDFVCEYAHTGERLDAAAFLAVNRAYPGGPWHVELLDLLDAGARGAALARVSDASGRSPEVHQVAILATLDHDLLGELVEVWAEVTPPGPDRRRG